MNDLYYVSKCDPATLDLIKEKAKRKNMTDGQNEALRAEAAERKQFLNNDEVIVKDFNIDENPVSMNTFKQLQEHCKELETDVIKYRAERKRIVELIGFNYSNDLVDVVAMVESFLKELEKTEFERAEFVDLQRLIIDVSGELDKKENDPVLRCALMENLMIKFLMEKGAKVFSDL